MTKSGMYSVYFTEDHCYTASDNQYRKGKSIVAINKSLCDGCYRVILEICQGFMMDILCVFLSESIILEGTKTKTAIIA